MSRQEFDVLPGTVRAEYVGGVAIVSPPASIPHNLVSARLVRLLTDALPGLLVVEVLSPSTWGEDLVRKPVDYLRALLDLSEPLR